MAYAALVRGPVAVGGHPVQSTRKQHKYDKRSVEASIELGQRVATFLESTYGHERSARILENVAHRVLGSQPICATQNPMIVLVEEEDASGGADAGESVCLPYGFWRRFMEDDMKIQYTRRKKMQMYRSLQFYVERKHAGASTVAAMRGKRDSGSCRSGGGAHNSQRAAGLGFMLLQFFVDHIQVLRLRADSEILLKKARDYRADLVHAGWRDADLPRLIGNAGCKWFQRWRESYNLVKKVTGMKLKTPWASVKRRIRVFLGNIFRLRAFWEIIHPGTPMRFISLDQKPSWFNNAGHTGTFAEKGGKAPTVREDFNKTRERYSILTCVPSWGHGDPNLEGYVPPKIAILFKGSATGTIKQSLRQSSRLQPWMLVQVQENGSYRSQDMVEALDFLLPSANVSTESIVVMLDWYSGHLTDEVAALVRSKGHVIVFHGGGCTPFTQINDTHLHALLARLLIQLENQWAMDERTRLVNMGKNKTPKMTREDIISIVQAAWELLNHEEIARKGYEQTGPSMPLRGPIAPEDVFADLLGVLEKIDPSPSPLIVGTTLRDEAVAHVRREYDAGRLTEWNDCHKLIEDQDGVGEAVVEGMEAYSYSAEDDEEGGDADNEDDDNAGGSPGGPDGGAGDGLEDVDDADITGDEAPDEGDDDGDDGPDGGAGGVVSIHSADAADSSKADGESAEAAESNRQNQLVVARQVLYDDAVRKGHHVMIKHMRKQMRCESKNQRDEGTKVSLILREKAKQCSDALAKLRQQTIQEERLSAKQVADTQMITAKAKLADTEAKVALIHQVIVNRRDAEERKHREVVERAFQRYLQTQYPALIGRTCTDYFRCMSKEAKRTFEAEIKKLRQNRTFERQVFVRDLWAEDKTLTLEWQRTEPLLGGAPVVVRCGMPFQDFMDSVAPPSTFGNDAVEILYRLFSACVPEARRIFTANVSPLRLLHVNHYVLEKAFVHGIIALSKWLGKDGWPCGVHGRWPPKMPADLVPKYRGFLTLNVDTAAPSQASSSSGIVRAGAAVSPASATVPKKRTTAASQAAPSSSGTLLPATATSSETGKAKKRPRE